MSDREEAVGYIANLFGIETDNEFVVMDIMAQLSEIANLSAYRKHIIGRIGDDDIKYMKPFQKFLMLTKEYKQLEIEAMSLNVMSATERWIKELCAKVKKIATVVLENQDINYGMLRDKHTKKPYFSDKERSALEAVGSILYCVKLQRSVSGCDMLEEKLLDIAKGNIHAKYLPKPKNDGSIALDMTKSAVKRF